MAHIQLDETLPGIRSLFAFRPQSALALTGLAETLLRGPSSLTPAEREVIATYVSSRNECSFCYSSHRAAAAHNAGGNYEWVDSCVAGESSAAAAPRLQALLAVAEKVRQGGRSVMASDIQRARNSGATDVEIHDTVLIAAAFCMFNRYVDGLAAPTPPANSGAYDQVGRALAHSGYQAAVNGK